MAHLNQFTYSGVTPVLAYLMSCLGSLLGLVATARARDSVEPRRRARWLILAAWAIGGTGIWVMHFIAMIGFTVAGTNIRYDVATTIASWLIAVIMVGFGLFIVGYGRPSAAKVLIGGIITGLSVAGMHYTGMAAMRIDGRIGYDRRTVILSVVIAVVAATVALWFTVTLRRPAVLVAAAALMGIAVSGMHYTGMWAVHVRLHESTVNGLTGLTPFEFLIPIILFVIVVIIALFYSILAVPSRQDLDAEHISAGPGFRVVQQAAAPAQNTARASGGRSVYRPRR